MRQRPIITIALLYLVLASAGYITDTDESLGQLTCAAVLTSHHRNIDGLPRKYSDLEVLGFVTPWNSKGIDIALAQASRGRLDVVSPVTWQMHPDGLKGGQDFDPSFFEKIHEAGSQVHPRIVFEHWSLDDFRHAGKQPQPVVGKIAQMCVNSVCDGVVLEIWQAMLAVGALTGKDKKASLDLIIFIGESLKKKHDLATMLVLPPYSSPEPVNGILSSDIKLLSGSFSRFIVMTYDFSTPGSQAGPLAPIQWVRTVGSYLADECQLGRKVLIGLNFYGVEFSQHHGGSKHNDRHIIGHEYVSLLREHKPDILWLEQFGEHAFAYNAREDQRIVFFPTRRSIATRLALAKDVGCGGVAVWELGQGLDYFFDEF